MTWGCETGVSGVTLAQPAVSSNSRTAAYATCIGATFIEQAYPIRSDLGVHNATTESKQA
jgi:hypothetical protein